MNKFREGDKVRYVGEQCNLSFPQKEEVGIIMYIYDGGYIKNAVKFKELDTYTDEELELVPKIIKRKFSDEEIREFMTRKLERLIKIGEAIEMVYKKGGTIYVGGGLGLEEMEDLLTWAKMEGRKE